MPILFSRCLEALYLSLQRIFCMITFITLVCFRYVEVLESWDFLQPGYSKKNEKKKSTKKKGQTNRKMFNVENKANYIYRNVTLISNATSNCVPFYSKGLITLSPLLIWFSNIGEEVGKCGLSGQLSISADSFLPTFLPRKCTKNSVPSKSQNTWTFLARKFKYFEI